MTDDIFITVTGFSSYFGVKVFKIGKLIRLSKDKDNNFDLEAINAEIPYFGKVGYVANSVRSKANGTMSAGYIYNMFEKYCFARVLFTTDTKVIAQLIHLDSDDESFVPDISEFM